LESKQYYYFGIGTVRKKNEKLKNIYFFRGLIQKVLVKKEKTGVTFRTFGVEHYKLEENMVQYKKRESPNHYNKQDLPYGTFLMGHEKMYRNLINLDIR
jgi:hypothetical protein